MKALAALGGLALLLGLGFVVFGPASRRDSRSEPPHAPGPAERPGVPPPIRLEPPEVASAPDAAVLERRAKAKTNSRSSEQEPGPSEPPDLPVRLVTRIVDLEDAPIPGARLRYRSEVLGVADESGFIEAEAPARESGRHVELLDVVAVGYAATWVDVELEAGTTIRLGTIRLGPGGVVEGTVLDSRDRPVPDVWVKAIEVEYADVAGAPLFAELRRRVGTDPSRLERLILRGGVSVDDSALGRVRTGAEGEFRLVGVAPGDWYAEAWTDEGRSGRSEALRVEPNDVQRVVLRLGDPPVTAFEPIRGRVLDPEGREARGVDVHVGGGGTWDTVSTEEDGAFAIQVGAAGPHWISCSDPEERWFGDRVEDVAPGTTDLVLRFEAPEWIEVRLLDPAGDPVPWGHVELTHHDRESPFRGTRDAGRSGRVDLPKPRLHFEAKAFAPGYRTELFGPFEPAAVGEVLELTMQPGQALSGRVTYRGRGVPGATVDVFPMNSPREPSPERESREDPFFGFGTASLRGADATTDSKGKFTATLHQDGWQGVRVELPDKGFRLFGPFEWSSELGYAGLELELEDGGSLAGRLIVPSGADPREWLVAVSNGWGVLWSTPADSGGVYRFDDLPPGPYQVRARRPPLPSLGSISYGGRSGRTPDAVEHDVVVRSGRTAHHDLDAIERGTYRLVGRLTWKGEGSAADRVVVHPPERGGDLSLGTSFFEPGLAAALLDDDGRFQLAVSTPGPHLLCFWAGMHRFQAEVTLAPGENEWALEIPFGTLRIRPDPAVADGLTPLRWSGSGRATAPEEIVLRGNARLFRNRDLVFERFPAGRVELSLLPEVDDPNPEDEWQLWREIEVFAGEELVLDYP